MLDKIITGSACFFLLGVMSIALSAVNLQFKFMSFLGDYKSIFDYTAVGAGLVVCAVASRIKKRNRDLDN
ncbi:MAG: hypothetical protein K0R23_3351 [Lacrimispora sp.]|nr:hypothetical protein [Lacrimispora sp.]